MIFYRRTIEAPLILYWLFLATVLSLALNCPAETGASLRTVTGIVDNSGGTLRFERTSVFSETALRITWKKWLTESAQINVHIVQSAIAFGSDISQESQSSTSLTPGGEFFRALDLSWEESSGRNFISQLSLDRASVRLELSAADLTIGRQPVTFGQAYFWNPLDVFFSFDPRQFDRDYKPGVDAVRADFALGSFSNLTLVAGAGSDSPANVSSVSKNLWNANWSGSALIAHLRATISGWDAAIQGGKVFAGYQTGLGLSGELYSMEVRLESAYFRRDKINRRIPRTPDTDFLVDNLQIVIGAGRLITPDLRVETEYLYNSAGARDKSEIPVGLARYASGTLPQAGRHTIGELTTLQLSPLWNSSLAILWSASDGSGVFQPGVTFSAASEIDILAGAIINWGEQPALSVPRSEFGSFPDSYYFEAKYYFW